MSTPTRRRTVLTATAVAALAATAGGSWWFSRGGSQAPQTTFALLDGGQLRTDDLRGQVALVNFWATSCVTCVGEMPQMIATDNRYRPQGLRTLAVAMHYDPPEYVRNFTRTRQLPFQVALDHDGSAAHQWGDVQATPTTYLLDRRSQIVARYVGAPDFDELHGRIEQLLSQPA